MTAQLKDAILQAAAEAGDGDLVAYLKTQALTNPGPFMGLLGKVLPLQISAEEDAAPLFNLSNLTYDQLTALEAIVAAATGAAVPGDDSVGAYLSPPEVKPH